MFLDLACSSHVSHFGSFLHSACYSSHISDIALVVDSEITHVLFIVFQIRLNWTPATLDPFRTHFHREQS